MLIVKDCGTCLHSPALSAHLTRVRVLQTMQVEALTRENVASHLQKYRLSLKRQANISESAVIDDAAWPLLERAHARHIAALSPPLLPSADAHEAVATTTATPLALPPPRAGAPTLPSSGLPAGFALPPVNGDGEAVGVPMLSAVAPLVHSHFGGRSPAAARPRVGTLPPLVLPSRPSSLMPSTFCPDRLAQQVAEDQSVLPGCPPWPPVAGAPAPADARMCTVYMVDSAKAAAAPAAHGALKAAEVPEMMVAVSLAAYNSVDGDPAAGAPLPAGSSGSACRRSGGAVAADDGTSPLRRGRRAPKGAVQKRGKAPRRGGKSAVRGGGGLRGTSSPMFGSSDALDVLAEVAGQLAEAEAL